MKSFLFIKKFRGLAEMTFGLVNASFSLPEWQGVKMTFFAHCVQRDSINYRGVLRMTRVRGGVTRAHHSGTLSLTLFSWRPGPSCTKGGQHYPADKSLSRGWCGWFLNYLSTRQWFIRWITLLSFWTTGTCSKVLIIESVNKLKMSRDHKNFTPPSTSISTHWCVALFDFGYFTT